MRTVSSAASPVSVRLRITGAVVALVALALLSVGGVFYALQVQRIATSGADDAAGEIIEFRSFVDTASREALAPGRVVQSFLRSNFPTSHELFLGYYLDGRPPLVSGDSFAELVKEPTFQDALPGVLDSGGPLRVDTRFGEAYMASQSVRPASRTAGSALVVVSFTTEEREVLGSAMRVAATVGLGALAIVSGGAWMVAGRLLRPVRELHAAAQAITHTDFTTRLEARGNDDLTALTHTFNAMVDRLEEAFTTQRQFLDDAGHELRTPITVVRGHLELLDRFDADDVEQTRQLVIDEIDRMARLVDDLLVLARSQRPDFLRSEPLELAALTDELAEKMRALGDRRWQVDHRGTASLLADRHRVTQAVLQLAANAVQHTRPGDLITIGSAAAGGAARIWIRDTGSGVPAAHQRAIFERFHRVDDSQPGTGLGLSIVSAIAAAHHGHVSVDSTPGEGATFTLVLPLDRRPPDGRWSGRVAADARPTSARS